MCVNRQRDFATIFQRFFNDFFHFQTEISKRYYTTIADILWKGPPYPQIVKPIEGGFWTLGFDETNNGDKLVLDEELPVVTVDASSIRIDEDESALTSYRTNFLRQVSKKKCELVKMMLESSKVQVRNYRFN